MQLANHTQAALFTTVIPVKQSLITLKRSWIKGHWIKRPKYITASYNASNVSRSRVTRPFQKYINIRAPEIRHTPDLGSNRGCNVPIHHHIKPSSQTSHLFFSLCCPTGYSWLQCWFGACVLMFTHPFMRHIHGQAQHRWAFVEVPVLPGNNQAIEPKSKGLLKITMGLDRQCGTT